MSNPAVDALEAIAGGLARSGLPKAAQLAILRTLYVVQDRVWLDTLVRLEDEIAMLREDELAARSAARVARTADRRVGV